MTLADELALGVSHQRAGRLAEAETIYRNILCEQPDHADALNLLGMLLAQTGRETEAVELIRRAIRFKPEEAAARYNLGTILRDLHRTDEAIAEYRQAIRLKPDFAEAYNNLGIALRQMGQVKDAVAAYRRAIVLKPDHVGALCNLGNALSEDGHSEESIRAFRQAIALKPDLAEAHNYLGSALHRSGQLQMAIASYEAALRLRRDYAIAHSNLGCALTDTGRFDEAISACREALRIAPDLPEAHNNLGNALAGAGFAGEAMDSLRQAIRLKPDFANAHFSLANALKDVGRLDQAIEEYRQAIRLSPDDPVFRSNLLYALWFHHGSTPAAIYEEHRQWNEHHAKPPQGFVRAHANVRDPNRALVIGYVSPDFRRHPVGGFMLPLLLNHDRENFRIVCYSGVRKSDDFTEKIRACTDHWRDIVGISHEQLAGQIRADGIDILVDLSGHSAGNQLLVFARKPAPIQVTYLGYPGTTGLTAMDYRLTDAQSNPAGESDAVHSETLWRLPVCNWCFAPPADAPVVRPAPVDRAITFGVFNNFAKASPFIIDLWARILRAVPDSRLMFKSRVFAGERVRLDVRRHFASLGVAPERLEIRAFSPDAASHLETYNRIDIALDTFPYHGTATTCESLWMGVPVVTLKGNAHVSRVGVSLMNCIGLPELIAKTADEYVSIAIGLANDLARLSQLRRSMRERMLASPLMDAHRFARDIENAYRKMWRKWCDSDRGA